MDLAITNKPGPLALRRDRELGVTLAMAVAEMLEVTNTVFLQAGAFDGVTNDDLYPLIRRHHFRGILLEPQPAAFQKLRAAYRDEPQVMPINAALDWSAGQRTMYSVADTFLADQFHPQLASFERDVVLRYPGVTPSVVREVQIDCVTVKECMRRAGIDRIDLLQVDTEGYDFEILKMIDGAGLRPKVVRYESIHLSRRDRKDCSQFLLDRGYRIAHGHENTIACLLP